MNVEQLTLPNTAALPVITEGTLEFDKTATMSDGKRHLKLEVYRLVDSQWAFAFSASFTSEWKQEVPFYFSRYASSFDDLAKRLRILRPTDWVRGYPRGKQFEQKQGDLMDEIEDRWAALVADAMVQLVQ